MANSMAAVARREWYASSRIELLRTTGKFVALAAARRIRVNPAAHRTVDLSELLRCSLRLHESRRLAALALLFGR